MKKISTTIGILWIIGAGIYAGMIYGYELSRGGARFEDLIGLYLRNSLALASPGIAVLLLIYIYGSLQKRRPPLKDVGLHNTNASNKKFGILHQDKSWMFLSYRRADSADIAGRIYDRLIQEFGNYSVFKDVDSLPLGLDFRNVLNQMVSQSRVFIAIIGPNWLGQVKDRVKRRIDDPSDFVRIEVRAALERGIPVIPLLVYGATMPHESELPEDLKALAYRNGTVIRPDPDFNHDINRVISGIGKLKKLPA